MRGHSLRLETSVDERTGRMRAAYLRVREGAVARTQELKDGVAYADYDADGLLLGIELLGPCEVQVLDNLGRSEPEPVKQFLKGGAPRELVLT